MQSRDKSIHSLVVAVMAWLIILIPAGVMAQTSSINAYSPYSMYGPGEILTPGSVQMRSMGGIGLGIRSAAQVNTLNPAAASMAPRKSFLFELNLDGTHYRNNQQKYSPEGKPLDRIKTAYNTANIHNISLAFPLGKGVGATISIAPYSSVGYKMNITDQQDSNWADIGRVVYAYSGEGDITEVKVAVGWEAFRKFSIGVALRYFWGEVERNYSTQVANIITGNGTYASTIGVDNYRVNNVKFQAGLQWSIIANDNRLLTLGATYNLGGKLKPEKHSYIYTDNTINAINPFPVRDRIAELELRIPHEVGVGIYYLDRKMAFGIDYNYATWGSNNSSFKENASADAMIVEYTDTHTIKLGYEITPKSSDVRNYLNRMSYRIGLRLGNYYQTFASQRINQLAVTAGLGLPVKLWGASSVNIGFEYGRMSAAKPGTVAGTKVGLVTQNYFKLSIGFSLFSADTSDYWFVRQKYD